MILYRVARWMPHWPPIAPHPIGRQTKTMPARDTLLSKEFGTEFAFAVFGAKKLSCVPDAMRMRRIVQLQQTSAVALPLRDAVAGQRRD
jgi:hypothetical protein